MQRALSPCVAGDTLEDSQNCLGLVSNPEVSESSIHTSFGIKRSASSFHKAAGRKRQRSTISNSISEDWSSSETCMSERTSSHNYASSSSSSASSSPLQSASQQAPPLLEWHSLPKPVPATFREVARLQTDSQTNSTPLSRWDLLCAVEFSPDGAYLAAAGVGKRVCIYPTPDKEQQDQQSLSVAPSCINFHPSKLSSLSWSPHHADVVALGDYDGVVTQLHTPTGHNIWQADDHDGARIWSVNFSQQDPSLLVSACEDGTARLWSHHSESCLNIIAPHSQAALCSAVFSPEQSHLLALASADHNAYVYDLRATQQPLYTLQGHQDSVSYVRFLSAGNGFITASIDGTLAHWQTDSGKHGSAQQLQQSEGSGLGASMQLDPVCVFKGHSNQRNFVGLAVEPATDLIACGSEDNEVYLYHTAWADPMGHQPLHVQPHKQEGPHLPGACGPVRSQAAAERSFASAVAWQPASNMRRPEEQLLAAALSSSGIQLFRPRFHCPPS